MKWLVLVAITAVLGACERSSDAMAGKVDQVAPTHGWKCFARHPDEPPLPQGDVTHTRQRLRAGRLEVESVHVQAGRGGATRLVFEPAGDHLEARFGGVTMTATLLAPDGARWILSYRDPASGVELTEESRLVDDGLTVTSTDPGEGGPVTTTVRFVSTPCANVVAELARYPA